MYPRRRGPKQFWNREYQKPGHLALSTEPSSDLQKFTRWLARRSFSEGGLERARVLDLGCGNGRNLIWLAQEFGARGVGYDISSEAIAQAKQAAGGLKLDFAVRSVSDPFPLADESVNLALDLMTAHFLRAAERPRWRDEIWRVLKPSGSPAGEAGWFLFKTFLLEGDRHAARLLQDHPAAEPHSYIHPTFGGFEHVWTLDEIEDFFLPQFIIHKVHKSHKHLARLRQGFGGQARPFRRRTVSVYLQKRD